MDCNRKPNTKCDTCSKDIYRRPNELKRFRHKFCSKICMEHEDSPYWTARQKVKNINCKVCQKEFKPEKRTAKFCSRKCSNRGRKGVKYNLGYLNKTQRRFYLLKENFDFNCCMVENCDYSICYDIHRLVAGKDGGKYEIGNMFAICPNHHAEVTRKLIEFKKVNNYTLKAI